MKELTTRYQGHLKKKGFFLLLLFVLLLIAIVFSITAGSIKIPFGEVLSTIIRLDTSNRGRIVWDVRMPRVLSAILVGGGLALSGVMMQSVLKNPLASPYTLGLSSAAAFGASFAIVFLGAGTSTTSTIIVSNVASVALSAFVFSIISTLAILALTLLTTISAQSMVLAGIAIGSIFSAGLTLMQYLANSVQLASIVSWTFGDLGRANWKALAIISIVFIPLWLLALWYSWDFNAMDSGEDSAKALGVRTNIVRIFGMLTASILSAVIVSFFGTIAFIGLLGPHIARRLFGGDHRVLLIASPLIGSLILLIADTVARTILAPMILPVGILTSLLGGPLFIYLLIAGRRR